MIRFFQCYLYFFLSLTASAQYFLSGTVKDEAGEPLVGANVYLEGTYDGATTDVDGRFRFETGETGDQPLVVSFVGFESFRKAIQVKENLYVDIQLKEAFNSMEAVSISAGSFEAGDKKKVVVLQSLDIATTAGATADITGALNTLPGTQTVGESGRLFVRGGTASETKIYIDGAEAANYYGASTGNIPTRSRFSPFLFKGTFFSTGGYSAEYGQALSSALILNTLDPEPLNQIDISLMSVGLDASITRGVEDESFYAKLGYLNLNPYTDLIDQHVSWINGTTAWDGLLTYKKRFESGAKVKTLGMGNFSAFALEQETILHPQGYDAISVKNGNVFGTANLEIPVGEKDYVYLGASGNWDKNDIDLNATKVSEPAYNYHVKTKYIHEISEKSVLNSGAEVFYEHYDISIADTTDQFELGYHTASTAVYTELDQYLSEEWMFRAGARLSHIGLLGDTKISPRFSMAHKLNDHEQISFASGLFYQKPDPDYLGVNDDLEQEKATHYILNYQRIKTGKVLRVETYYKGYENLVRYQGLYDPVSYTNDGDGYAYGLDLFWRDRGGIKNLDYWVSYSWMKSERLFRDFPEKSEPGFSSAHNFSLVVKRWFADIKTQMGATYAFTSGRPYENPNLDGFNESRTKAYHDLSFNAAYLPTANVILYFSATNLLGLDQVFGYRSSQTPNGSGQYLLEAVRLPAKRFVFLGCFITIGAFNKQLENL